MELRALLAAPLVLAFAACGGITVPAAPCDDAGAACEAVPSEAGTRPPASEPGRPADPAPPGTSDPGRPAAEAGTAPSFECYGIPSCNPSERPKTCADGKEIVQIRCEKWERGCEWRIKACEGSPCTNDVDCGAIGGWVNADVLGDLEGFCVPASGTCGGPGTCAARPRSCDDVVEPVCGCDGVTHANACRARQAGTTVAKAGECWPPKEIRACGRPGDLACDGATEWCDRAVGCSGAGTCRERPRLCAKGTGPVCGCDGKTYPDTCSAAAAGQDVAREGAC